MTIIKPSQYSHYIRFLVLVLGIILLGGALYIFEYNALVDTRFQLRSLKDQIVEKQALNADLKNTLYKITEPKELQELAEQEGLILERNPEFLSSDKWLSDSSF